MTTKKITPLNELKKEKKILSSKISSMKNKDGEKILQTINWERDLLPEYLWIDYLFQKYPYKKCRTNVYFENLIDRIDPLLDKDFIFLGLVSDFGKIPPKKRKKFKRENSLIIQKTVIEPMGYFLKLYKDSPMSWLLNDSEELSPEEINETLKLVSESVIRLINAKDEYCGLLRVMPFIRLLKHGKILFNMNDPEISKIVESMKVYPEGCNDEERYLIESQARTAINFHVEDKRNGYQLKEWPKYFWRHNYDISGCIPAPIHINVQYNPKNVDIKKLNEIIEYNIDLAFE